MSQDTPLPDFVQRPEAAIRPDSPIAESITAVDAAVTAAEHPTTTNIEKAATNVNNVVHNPQFSQDLSEISTVVSETRRGYKTSEFYTTLATVGADLGLDISTKEKLFITILAGVYALARGFAKAGVPNVTPVLPEGSDGP